MTQPPPDTFLCLGNPGARYSLTRHNIGFLFGKHILNAFPSTPLHYHKSLLAFLSIVTVEKREVRIVFPDTYMNNSGETAKRVMNEFSIDNKSLAVVYDDVDLPFETHRIRMRGGTAGHKGLSSIVHYSDTDEIIRVRLGIGKPEVGEIKSFVLQNFLDDELTCIHNIWGTQWQALFSTLATLGGEEAMNKFNGGNR